GVPKGEIAEYFRARITGSGHVDGILSDKCSNSTDRVVTDGTSRQRGRLIFSLYSTRKRFEYLCGDVVHHRRIGIIAAPSMVDRCLCQRFVDGVIRIPNMRAASPDAGIAVDTSIPGDTGKCPRSASQSYVAS
ncbi:MAG TPA: hypothetical protein VNZ58_09565, partial [Thermomicrobiales bacterium]|nr:hypothetical protein [Thermomicrobiales bacterium]